jgi:sterol desaturase/sphingolipid hydroxylase (fatty acid hydroxylase superfamily)
MAGPTYAAVLYTQKHGIGIAHLLGLSGAVEIIAAVIALDFWDYWMHLVNHKIKFLWRFHKAHHSDMEVDVTTASRFHIGELLISGSVKCLMIFVWGPSLLSIQDNIEKIIVTPRMHRCHHALHENCFNTNFATIFSFWDRLFKSYHWAKEKPELQPIGVFSPRGPATMKLVPFMMTPLK